MSRRLPALIFDLDGTLTDSKPGIIGCLRKVLDVCNIDGGPLDRFIGPPVEAWVIELLPNGTNEERAALARDYRACYDREGWHNNSVFPGVAEMLGQLHHDGFPLCVCTSKREDFAIRIVEAFGLARFFGAIYGDKDEYSSHSKVDLLARILRDRSLDRESAWMVGDRIFDIEAAHANNIRCIAAGWGYGTAAEYAQADALAATPASIFALTSSLAPEPASAQEQRILPA